MEKYAQLNIEKRTIADLIPHPDNPRSHPDSQIAKMIVMLQKLGYYRSIVVQKDTDYVLAGHGILESLKRDSYTHVDVSIHDGDNIEALELLLWDNRSGELSAWDAPLRDVLLVELQEAHVEIEEMGFDLTPMPEGGGEPDPSDNDEWVTDTYRYPKSCKQAIDAENDRFKMLNDTKPEILDALDVHAQEKREAIRRGLALYAISVNSALTPTESLE